MLKRILLAVLLAVHGFAAAVTCQTFSAGDTNYITKLNLLVAGCSPTGNLATSLPRAAAGGTVDVITATFSPAITLADQTIVAVVATGANATTTPTFAPNGLTARTIVARGGAALNAGDIAGAGFVALLEYNLANTRWELLNPASSAGGTVTNVSNNFTGGRLVIANNGSDTTTSAGITSDAASQVELGVAGSEVGSVKFRNATSGSITLRPTTGALGTRTITMPAATGTMALTSDITSPTLTATYVGYGSGANALTGTSDLTYATATGTLTVTQAVNAAMRINVWNTSTGTGAFSALTATNDNNNVAQLIKYGTLWTTSGLLASGWASLYNNSEGMLYANTAATDHVWSRGGTAATHEVMRLNAGALSLGVNGTTGGSLVIRGSTSGSATLSADAAAGSGTLTFGSSTATFSGSVTDSKGELRILPQNSQSAAYTTVLADSGKHILHPSADTTARTFTIDSNANVAYPIGTMITIVNQNAAGVLTIAITSDTMRLAGPGTTGSRTMAANCVATALKIVATEWIISGGSCLT